MNKKPLEKIRILFHLAEHCNLKCQGCFHFSCIAEPEFPNIEDFTRDMKRMKELFDDTDVAEVRLLGGEPLLNKDINDFICVARRCFPEAPITIVTNGILLLKKEDAFWTTSYECNAEICITKYPIPIDFDAIFRKGKEFSVKIYFYEGTDESSRQSFFLPLDIHGTHDAESNFMNCIIAASCTQLRDGHMYTCVVPPNVYHFNRYFGLDLQVDAKDSINIHTAHSAEEILDFLSRPIPFCRYCNIEGRKWGGEGWNRSQKKIEEWIADVSLDQHYNSTSHWKNFLSLLDPRRLKKNKHIII